MEGNITDFKLSLRYLKGSYTFDKILCKPETTDQKLFDLADALSSLQVEQPTKVVKIVTAQLA